ncbi:unnamed protein product [Clavelina lepadiformis]|uniref:Ig-like domain-containing protein n=1 Tax=Clavelina lepadiformis TaxID=159417 RepID=A0ABP0GQZ9_CLALP
MKDALLITLICSCCFVLTSWAQKPSIIEDPQDVTVRQGDDVTLRCVVKNLPYDDLTPVQWTRGGFALGYDRNLSNWERYSMVGDVSIGEYNLHIINVDANEDEQIYECQVTQHNLRSKKAKLTVQVPPVGPLVDNFDSETEKVNVVTGKMNEITCKALNGKPAARLVWYRDGLVIVDDVTTVVSEPKGMLYNTSTTLRITPGPDDVDVTYACVMLSEALEDDEFGRIMLKLNMIEPPKVEVSLPAVIKEGDYVNAECRAVADPPVLSYRWFVNGEVQPDEHGSTFGIGVAERSLHRSLIGCEARNDGGLSKRDEIVMEILYAPVFVNGSDDVISEIGDDVTLRCEWDSNPQAAVYWVRERDDVILSRDTTLVLNNVTQDDSGSYVCHANAGNVGKDKATMKLVVRGPPQFGNALTQYTVIGDDVSIICSLNSDPGIERVTWSWTHRDTPMTIVNNETKTAMDDVTSDDESSAKYRGLFTRGESSARLEVVGVDLDDLHSYQCAVSNTYGGNSLDIVLNEGTGKKDNVLMLGAIIGGAVAGLILVVVILVALCCVRSRRRQKSTKFAKKGHGSNSRIDQDERVPINQTNIDALDPEYNPRASVSSHSVAPASSVSGSDDATPTPTSGHDDGYHTEEANSWNRDRRKLSIGSASPTKTSSLGASYPGYASSLPPPMEIMEMDHSQFPNSSQYIPAAAYSAMGSRPMSPSNRHAYDQDPYDPTTLSHPVSTIRSVSALGDRLSPPPVRYVQRNYSDVGALATSNYSAVPTPAEYYATNPRPYTPMQYGPQVYPGGNRTTPIPASISGGPMFYQHPMGSSQSSLDKFERGSALSASVAANRAMDYSDNAPRMTNLSRMSQSSKQSDALRAIPARMATHV